METDKKNFVLGKKVTYKAKYDPSLLVFVPREEKRNDIGYNGNDVNFKGFDLWNAYEVSYLLPTGKPVTRIGILTYSALTENIVESKSLKLYLNSFNMTHLMNDNELESTIKEDLREGLNDNSLEFRLFKVDANHRMNIERGYDNIDDIDIKIDNYKVDKGLLKKVECKERQRLSSHLLKSNCLVTGQPDWGSVYIRIVPDKYRVDEKSLLKYIVSFRQHNEFHEQCCERIIHDLNETLKPKAIEVFCKYVRRGGLDINPYRIIDPDVLIQGSDFRTKLESDTFERDPRQ